MTNTILVTGATGKTGRRLIALLQDQGVSVRAASRAPSAGQVAFDWENPVSQSSALSGVTAIYLIPPALVEDPTSIVAPFLTLAKAAGVRGLVLVSSMGTAFPAEPQNSGRRKLEALVRDSGLDWTILRPSGFMQNFSEGFLLPAVRNGAIPNPAGQGEVAMVDAGDIAAVAAAVLVDAGQHAGRIYDVTGPSAISFEEVAQIIAREAGRSVTARPMTSPQFLAMLESAGVPSDYAAMLLSDQEAIRHGAAASVSDTVTRLVGRPPRSFSAYAAEAAGAWR